MTSYMNMKAQTQMQGAYGSPHAGLGLAPADMTLSDIQEYIQLQQQLQM